MAANMKLCEAGETGLPAANQRGMRVLGMIGLVGSVVLVPVTAFAGGRHGSDDGPTVRDHRSGSSNDSSSDDKPVVRDHRTHDDGPTVRDHRTHDDGPRVRDHRGSNDDGPRVRDHRSSDDVYYTSNDTVVVNDGGPSNPFAHVSGPTWTLELGGFAHRFRGPSMRRSGQLETYYGDMASFDLASGPASDGDTAGGTGVLRFTMPVSEHLYAGAELGIGGLTRTPVRLMTDSPELHVTSRAMFEGAGVIGARARRGIFELDGEMAGGFRAVSVSVAPYDYEEEQSATETGADALLEARLRGVLWVAPHVFVAAQAGVGVLDRDDKSIGVSIGVTSRPFARMR
jgi:hypothetical protein